MRKFLSLLLVFCLIILTRVEAGGLSITSGTTVLLSETHKKSWNLLTPKAGYSLFKNNRNYFSRDDSLRDRANVWKSFLIPGWGEYSMSHKNRAKVFFTSEITLIVIRAIFKTYEKQRRSDYKNYAVTHAGINPAGKGYYFYVDIGNYISIYEYNSSQLRYRSPDNLYLENEDWYWYWDSDKNRHRFRQMRIDADRANVYATFTTGFIVLNHLISLFDSLYLYRSKYGIVEFSTRGNKINLEYKF